MPKIATAVNRTVAAQESGIRRALNPASSDQREKYGDSKACDVRVRQDFANS